MCYPASTANCIARIIALRHTGQAVAAQLEAPRHEAGRCWSDMVNAHPRARESGEWLTCDDQTAVWKADAIPVCDRKVIHSNGSGRDPLMLQLYHEYDPPTSARLS